MKHIARIQKLLAWLRPMQISIHSAYTGFFLILSLFPCMLLLLGLLRYTPLEVRDLLGLLEGLLPESLMPVAQILVESSYTHSSGALVSISAVAALWSASRGMYGLVNGLNAVGGTAVPRSYLRRRGMSMLYTLVFLMLLVLTLVLHVFGNSLVDYLQMTTRPGILRLLQVADLQFFLLLLLQTGLFSLLYTLLPARRERIKHSLPGAALASLGWLLSSQLFSVYMQFYSGYTNIFGSLYGLALGMLWLYFCISILFYGAALNRLIFREKWKI